MAIIQGIDREKVAIYLSERWKTLVDDRRLKEEVWNDCVYAYYSRFSKAWVSRAQEQGRSHRYLPMTWDAAENVSAAICAIIFSSDDWLQLGPAFSGIEDTDNIAAAIQRHLHMQHLKMKFKPKFKLAIKQMVITGNCPLGLTWRVRQSVDFPTYHGAVIEWEKRQREKRMQWQEEMATYKAIVGPALLRGIEDIPPPPPEPDAVLPQIEPTISYAGPSLEVWDVFNFVIDNRPDSPETALRGQRTWRSLPYLARLTQKDELGYSLYDEAGLRALASSASPNRRDTDNKDALRAEAFGVRIPDKTQPELVSWYGDFEVPLLDGGDLHSDQLFESFCAVVGNGTSLLRFEPVHTWTGDLPMLLGTLIPVPGEMYGMGVIEQSLGSQDYINARANQVIDASAAAINPEYTVVDDGVINLRGRSGPGRRHLVLSHDTIKPIQKNVNGLQLGYMEVRDAMFEHGRWTRNLSPASPPTGETATKSQMNMGTVAQSFNDIVDWIETTVLTDLINLQVQYNGQYQRDVEHVPSRKDGKTVWDEIPPEWYRKGWIVKVLGSKYYGERVTQVQQNIGFLQVVAGNPTLRPFIDALYILKKTWRQMGNDDEEKVIVDGAEMLNKWMLMANLKQLMAQMTMAMGGAGDVGSGREQGAPKGGSGTQAGDGTQGAGGQGNPGSSSDAGVQDPEGLASLLLLSNGSV